ncbi:MAG: 50S ribosomal protein L7Ae [Candidatus Thermoplasmatota archaeon]
MAKAMYVRFEMSKEMMDKTAEILEVARETGKVRKGTNEVTKLIERGDALFVVMAEDVQPEEILAHIPLLCEEKNVPYAYLSSKADLGARVGLDKPTASAAVVDLGKAKELFEGLIGDLKALKG